MNLYLYDLSLTEHESLIIAYYIVIFTIGSINSHIQLKKEVESMNQEGNDYAKRDF